MANKCFHNGERRGMQRQAVPSRGCRSCQCPRCRANANNDVPSCGGASTYDRSDRGNDTPCGYSGECAELMHRLQTLDFSIQETVLHLDAYPNCQAALEHYRMLVKERCAVAERYEQLCGPVSAHGNGDREDWAWAKGPWPWHPDFPGNKMW